ncbi:MAG: phage major capsid protein [Methanolobus sp.]|nr:phage major capsid protein [Methanolobus sp.]
MEKNTQRLIEIAQRRKEIDEELKNASIETLEKLELEVRSLNDETIKIRKETLERINEEGKEIEMPEKKKDFVEEEDQYSSLEYRQSFRDYVNRKSNKILERLDATTETTNVGAIIPTTIMNRVIEELKDYGDILSRVTFTNFQGGVKIPIGGTKPVASWTSEGSVAGKQKQDINGSVTFSYNKLQMRVAITLIAGVVSLDLWEQTVAKNIVEAMGIALETAVINGTGNGQPLGITADLDLGAAEGRIAEEQQIAFKTSDATYSGWIAKLFSNIPLAYRKRRNGVMIMNPLTFDKYIWGLVDATTGQPIARVNYGIAGAPEYRFLGKEVVLTELLPDLDTASDDDVVVIYGDLSDYLINTNLQMTFRQFFDENTDEYIHKSTLIADGKLGDTYGFVVLVKDS